MYQECHRCHASLPEHDESELIYCSRCGSAQVLLSQELLAQVEEQAAAPADAPAAQYSPELQASLPQWSAALRYAGLAVAISAGLGAISMVLPPVSLFSMLWAIASPVVVLGLFHSKYPLARLSAAFGARLGLVIGLGISVVLLAGNAVSMLVTRRAGGPDPVTEMTAMWQRQPNMMQDPSIAYLIEKLHTTPEYRAGLLLISLAFVVSILLALTTAAGAYAGYARSRRR